MLFRTISVIRERGESVVKYMELITVMNGAQHVDGRRLVAAFPLRIIFIGRYQFWNVLEYSDLPRLFLF